MQPQMGDLIAARRKERSMTQKDLADALHITDKAVSKWERNLSCPDLALVPALAELLGLTADELLRATPAPQTQKAEPPNLLVTVSTAVGFALGVAGLALTLLGKGDAATLLPLLAVGLTALGLAGVLRLPR